MLDIDNPRGWQQPEWMIDFRNDPLIARAEWINAFGITRGWASPADRRFLADYKAKGYNLN